MKNADSTEEARVAELLRQILPVTARRAGLLNDAAVTTALPRYELERIAAPTLAISVADDLYGTYEGARYTAEQIVGARFKDYPSGGHLLVGHNEEALADIAAFLEWSQPSAEASLPGVSFGRPESVSPANPPLPG